MILVSWGLVWGQFKDQVRDQVKKWLDSRKLLKNKAPHLRTTTSRVQVHPLGARTQAVGLPMA